MKKIVIFLAIATLAIAQVNLVFLGGIGVTKGSDVLNDQLFRISLSSGANYGLKAQAMAGRIGVEVYYTLNTLESNAIDKVTNGKLDFSDKFANYGIGLVLQGGGILNPYLSFDYGKTRFLGSHKYATDGKHYSLGLGVKFAPAFFGVWGEARILRVSDLLKEFSEFKTEGKFTTFSVTVGGLIKF